MARLNNKTYRSLNESISQVQNPQAALDEALEYVSFLEGIIDTLCEKAVDLDERRTMFMPGDKVEVEYGGKWVKGKIVRILIPGRGRDKQSGYLVDIGGKDGIVRIDTMQIVLQD
jgi:hypothetical protein